MRQSAAVAKGRPLSISQRLRTQSYKTRSFQPTTWRTVTRQRMYSTSSENVFSIGPETSLHTVGLLYFKRQYERLQNYNSKEQPFEDLRMDFEKINTVDDLNTEIKNIVYNEHEDLEIALQHAYTYFRRFLVSSHRNAMKKPVKPNGTTFRFLMRACYNVGADQCIVELLDIMKDKFGLRWEYQHLAALYHTAMKSGTARLIQHSLKLAVEHNCAKKEWFEPGWERCKQLGQYMEAIEVLRAMNTAGEEVPEQWKQEARGFLGLYRSKKLRESTEQEDKYLKEPLSDNWQSLLQNINVS